MPELRRTLRTVTTTRTNQFGSMCTVEEEDDYTIEADTTGEICVVLKNIEREVYRGNDY